MLLALKLCHFTLRVLDDVERQDLPARQISKLLCLG